MIKKLSRYIRNRLELRRIVAQAGPLGEQLAAAAVEFFVAVNVGERTERKTGLTVSRSAYRELALLMIAFGELAGRADRILGSEGFTAVLQRVKEWGFGEERTVALVRASVLGRIAPKGQTDVAQLWNGKDFLSERVGFDVFAGNLLADVGAVVALRNWDLSPPSVEAMAACLFPSRFTAECEAPAEIGFPIV
jgi:hypothetical protein